MKTPEIEKMESLIETVNIAANLDEDKLKTIGRDAQRGFESDLQSRQPWADAIQTYIDLANQTTKSKTYPWPNAANVKYPLLSIAAMQFAARAYPALVPSDGRIVKGRVVGKDPDGSKHEIAEAVSIFMSWQLLHDMDGWEEDMDKLLITLPIVGVMFKKTYWDKMKEKNCSSLIQPQNLVVDYWAKSLDDAERVSEIIEVSERKVKERQMSKTWLDVALGDPVIPDDAKNPPILDETTPYTIIEQHTYLDLDEDGYKEPYIVTFHRQTGKVLRIAARFNEDGIVTDDEGTLIRIEPIQYYTKFGFVPNPDGSFYDIGFGVLLGPLNESVNTIINQLIDAGHLSSLQGGFLGKGLRLRMGEQRFQPGEWKVVNATGDDLKKQIVPLPVKEPSNVLFELMGSLITSGKELASVAEIFVGKTPGQNTPATTTMATIEQGMKVFTAVYKRIYRSLGEEFAKLFRLNSLYLNPNTYNEVVGMSINPEDFDEEQRKVFPGADPTAVSQTEKLLKAQGLLELLGTGMLDPVEVVNRVLEAQEQPNREKLFNKQIQQTGEFTPPPDPKLQEMQMKGQFEQMKIQQKGQEAQQRMELEARDRETQLAMKQQEHASDIQHKLVMNALEAKTAEHNQKIFSAEAQAKAIQGAVHNEQSHQQKMRHAEEQASVKARVAAKTSKGAKKA